MNLNPLKEKLGDATFAELKNYVDGLTASVADMTGQRDTARNESINGRKGLKTANEQLTARVIALSDRLGVEPDVDLDTLPDLKGAADAAKALGSKLTRAERERDDALKARDEATGKFRSSLQRAAVAEAMGGHEFIARDIVETHVAQSLVWEGDDLYFKAKDGKLIPVKDAVAGIAKERPELLKSTGAGGAGFSQRNAGSGAGKTMTRADFDAADPATRMAHAKAGGQVVDA